MNKVKKCSISGVAFIFEDVAFNRLSEYIDSLKRAYKDSAECDEIIADIEARIAELILSAQSNQQQVVCLPLVENIIAQLGSAADISGSDTPTEPTTATRIARRLYRDMDNCKLGGVCAGIGKYFSIDPVLVRLAIFAPFILLPIGGISYRTHWISDLGGNLFAVMIILYLILWFVIPVAKSARQKLEMEGEAVTAKAIADHKGTTDEQRAKSNLASFVAGLGRVGIVLIKAFVLILLFPLVACVLALIVAIFACATGLGLAHLELGNLASLADFGPRLPIFVLLAILVPVLVVLYLLTMLVINRRPKGWVLLCSLIVWVLLIISTVTAGVKFIGDSNIDEVERIMKMDWDEHAPSEPIDSLEYNRLMNDPNVESID